jgi:hypothetical protein
MRSELSSSELEVPKKNRLKSSFISNKSAEK